MTRNTKLSTPNNRVIAPQSTCKSIKHQVSILPHWFIPSLLPLHLVGTSNSDSYGGGVVEIWWRTTTMVASREEFRPFVMTSPEGVRRSFKVSTMRTSARR